jgi:hypothetical protein
MGSASESARNLSRRPGPADSIRPRIWRRRRFAELLRRSGAAALAP